MKVGFVGAGRMGRPIIDRLVAAGHELTVLTRRPEARAAAENAGLTCAGSVRETVRDAQVVFNVVLDDAQVRAALLGEEGAIGAMPVGAILVQHTTCDPRTALSVATAGAGRGVRVLDAAISGTPGDIADGQLTLWVGGEEAALDEIRPLLDTYASPIMFVGPVGNGQRVKLVNNALFVAQVGLAVDAVRLAGSMGISEPQILAAVQQGSGGSRALGSVASIGVEALGPRLAALMSKDVSVVREVSKRSGVDLGLLGDVLGSAVVERQILAAGVASAPARDGEPASPAPARPADG